MKESQFILPSYVLLLIDFESLAMQLFVDTQLFTVLSDSRLTSFESGES